MPSKRYALVAYVKSETGEFTERLGRELHPQSPTLSAHLTILPPRLLPASEAAALHWIKDVCARSAPFSVALGNVETFLPTTPTVYIRVTQSAEHMSALHQLLNTGALTFNEEWPYVPHLTLAKLEDDAAAQSAAELAKRRWAGFQGSRIVHIEHLTFVREDSPNHWVDLAPIPLGPARFLIADG